MSAFLTKLVRVSDKATIIDVRSFWTASAIILGVVFAARLSISPSWL